MALEIEHKYLVTNDSFKNYTKETVYIKQGYLSRVPERTVRVRIINDKGYITIKGKNKGDVRLEFEYEIPLSDALELLKLAEGRVIEKRRYIVKWENKTWEIDEFYGDREGLTIAEIELSSSDEKYTLPPFVGENVTGDPRYYNSNL